MAPQLKQRRVCSRLRSSATSTVPEAVTEASDREQWAACNQLVQQRCGASEDEANTALLRAFGWKGQGFWRQVITRLSSGESSLDLFCLELVSLAYLARLWTACRSV